MDSPKVVTRNRSPKLFPAMGYTTEISGASGAFMPTTWYPQSTCRFSPVTPLERSLSK